MARRVLLTGASSGIGEATVERLLEAGWEVIATGRRPEDLARLEAKGCTAIELDLKERDTIPAVAREILELGPLDAVVHNAGVGVPGAIEDLTPDAWEKQFQVNVFGTLELTRCLVPAVRERKGRFVFISSQAALLALPLYAAYCGSKRALEAAADALRMELAPDGVKVVIVEPGPVTTPFHDRAESQRARYVDEEGSRHEGDYEAMDRAITESVTGKVPPEAVADAVYRALTRRWVPARMHVGKLTWFGTMLARLLPSGLRDRVVRRSMGL
ncbi:MAG: SDR family oxidoreductase [Candidatus Thermoplasmatota archaeon]|nr:SDR family oxidoreductase [Candidatus Thermoplasmatota archaeon]